MSVMQSLSEIKRFVRGPAVETGNRTARVIAVAARKGGVGKTTTTVNLGADLARLGRKVLLIDMDAQGHVQMSLRDEARGRSKETLSDVLLSRRRDVQELVQPTSIDGLWFVGSDHSLNDTESIMGTKIGKELLLRQALKYARTHYDVILIDCPPNLGTLTVNALVACDQVLIPCDLSTLSLDGVDALLDTLETIQDTLNPDLSLLGLVRTRVDRRNKSMNAAIEATLTQRYGHFMLPVEIGVSTAIAKAQHAGQPVSLFDSQSRGAKGYQALAVEIDRRLG
ncbi:MAG: chromosome partitioning protein [Myxococcota bacterium]|jgi:chromosome partitioning protein